MESPSGKIERSEDIYNYFSESILGAIQDIILRRLLNSIVSRLVVCSSRPRLGASRIPKRTKSFANGKGAFLGRGGEIPLHNPIAAVVRKVPRPTKRFRYNHHLPTIQAISTVTMFSAKAVRNAKQYFLYSCAASLPRHSQSLMLLFLLCLLLVALFV